MGREFVEAQLLQIIKLPRFYTTDPLIWFKDVEDKFLQFMIVDEHLRYRLIVRSLPDDFKEEIREVLTEWPSQHTYSDLKKAIFRRQENPEMESLRKRTLTIQLEEKRPSEMLAALHEHTKDMKVEEEVLRHIWLEKLPLDLRHSLASSESTSVSSKKSSVLTSCRSSTLDILRGLSFDTVVEKQREIMCRIRWWYDWLNTGSRCFTEKVNWADSVHYESSSIAVELCFGRKFGLRYRTISENTQMTWCNTGSKSNAVKQTVGQIKSQIRHKLVNKISI